MYPSVPYDVHEAHKSGLIAGSHPSEAVIVNEGLPIVFGEPMLERIGVQGVYFVVRELTPPLILGFCHGDDPTSVLDASPQPRLVRVVLRCLADFPRTLTPCGSTLDPRQSAPERDAVMKLQPINPRLAYVPGQEQVIPQIDQILGPDEVADVVIGALAEDLLIYACSLLPIRQVLGAGRAAPSDVDRQLHNAAGLLDAGVVKVIRNDGWRIRGTRYPLWVGHLATLTPAARDDSRVHKMRRSGALVNEGVVAPDLVICCVGSNIDRPR